MIKVYAYVAGDLWHVGHKSAMHQAKALGDYLIVGVLTDEAIAAYKRWPVIPLEERMELVEDCKAVDEVIRQNDVDPTENLKSLDVDIVVHGDDWDENFPGAGYMRSIGKQAILTRYHPGQSTTKIIEKIRGGTQIEKWIDQIIKRCAPRDMYDDNGYCETKIRRLGVFYERLVGNNGDCHCPECMLQLVLHEISRGNTSFEYKDLWQEDFQAIKDAKGKAV